MFYKSINFLSEWGTFPFLQKTPFVNQCTWTGRWQWQGNSQETVIINVHVWRTHRQKHDRHNFPQGSQDHVPESLTGCFLQCWQSFQGSSLVRTPAWCSFSKCFAHFNMSLMSSSKLDSFRLIFWVVPHCPSRFPLPSAILSQKHVAESLAVCIIQPNLGLRRISGVIKICPDFQLHFQYEIWKFRFAFSIWLHNPKFRWCLMAVCKRSQLVNTFKL